MEKIILFLIIVLALVIGWFGNDVYHYYNLTREIDGLWIGGVNESKAREIASIKDAYGDWVCVNIRGMTFERAVEVCQHETGHEIFAEVCEKNMTKCYDILK